MLSDLFILLIYLGIDRVIAHFSFIIVSYSISGVIFQRFRLPISELKGMVRSSVYLLVSLDVVALIFVVIGVIFNLMGQREIYSGEERKE